jgi:hypothetical protein
MKDKINWFGNAGSNTTEIFKDVGKGAKAVITLVVAGAVLGTVINFFKTK